ncbi:bifunctional DNA primase/polymerase [Ensifer sp. 2YAB10]|uniref:bifunctional DNA primase/polymerase n=1 Tax=unclassified Ensifer TaxID=2633371 RepID=UPI003F8FCBD6
MMHGTAISPLIEIIKTWCNLGAVVFPVRGDKTPLLKDWRKKASRDPQQLHDWFAPARDGHLAYGIECARSGLVVVDIDMADGKDGEAAWNALLAELGIAEPATYQVATPRGGRHLYFRAPPGLEIKNSAGKLAENVDVRGSGGFIIGPLSRTAAGIYEPRFTLKERPIADLPPELVERLGKPKARLPAATKSTATASAGEREGGMKGLAKELANLRAAKAGGRNDALNKAAFAVFALVKGGYLDEAKARDHLSEAAAEIGLEAEEVEKTLASAWDAAEARRAYDDEQGESRQNLELEDFFYHLPSKEYIFRKTGDCWPGASVNLRVAPRFNGYDDKGEEKWLPASSIIAARRCVEQMTWFPGYPELIVGKLMAGGALIDEPTARIYNLYRPGPNLSHGNPAKASRWLDHINGIYPDDVDHIVTWLAHRLQRPFEKCNHALVLIGEQGVGKDTILYPVIQAIGRWNHQAISPQTLLGRFNSWQKSVLLQINEGRDLGEVDRYSFYERSKPIIAAPPDSLLVDEKNRQEYSVPNVCGVVIGSNYHTDGLYLPEDDRRHYVAKSELEVSQIASDYFRNIYRWFTKEDGIAHVAAYLGQIDLSGFDPAAPPPKTPAFWEIINSEQAPEVAMLREAIDQIAADAGEYPTILTLDMLRAKAPQGSPLDLWLTDKKYRRQIPKQLERAGFVMVPSSADNKLWTVNNKRVALYGWKKIPKPDRNAAAKAFQ